MAALLQRVLMEPPLRLIYQKCLRMFPVSLRSMDSWELAPRSHYFTGVHAAALQARSEGVQAITVAEFGVASGNGLLALEWCAAKVSNGTGVRIDVVGFDSGEGLPQLCGDYRDHPDRWKTADYPQDSGTLRKRLKPTTRLLLGNVDHTVDEFLATKPHPLGFAAMDLDLYSSTKSALRVFTRPNRRQLRRTFLYFDDIDYVWNHRFAGELLAIDEFNAEGSGVRIDVWRGLMKGRPFPEQTWLRKMYVAHDLEAISAVTLQGPPARK